MNASVASCRLQVKNSGAWSFDLEKTTTRDLSVTAARLNLQPATFNLQHDSAPTGY
jgi:hypothetical protein